MRSKIVIMENHESGVEVKGVSSLLDVYDRTKSGDLVVVYPGTYDIGNNSIQLKDGVNWQFIGNPTITSSSINGTFIDNNVAVNVKMDGDVTLKNTGGVNPVILTNSLSRMIDTVKKIRGAIGVSFDFTIPAIEPDATSLIQVELDNNCDERGEPVIFYSSTSTDDDIKYLTQYTTKRSLCEGQPNNYNTLNEWLSIFNHQLLFQAVLIVSLDYMKAERLFTTGYSSEKIDSIGTAIPFGFTYEQINAGVLVGWYSVPNKGVLGIDKRVILESGWLTHNGSNYVLNMRLRNVDIAANTPLDLKVAVIR